MLKYIILLAVLSLKINLGLACDCVIPVDSYFNEVIKDSDFIFTGTIINSSKNLIVLDSIIKGNLNVGDTIYLHQFFSSGNCTAIFSDGSKQLIIGNHLESMDQIFSKDQIILETGPTPNDRDTISSLNEYSEEQITNLKSSLIDYVVVETAMCRSFSIRSKEFKQVMALLKN